MGRGEGFGKRLLGEEEALFSVFPGIVQGNKIEQVEQGEEKKYVH